MDYKMFQWWLCSQQWTNTGLRPFLNFSVIVYEDTLVEFYANSTITADKKTFYSSSGQTYQFDESMFAYTFSLSTEGISSQLSKSIISQMKLKLSISDSAIHVSCNKKKMKMKF